MVLAPGHGGPGHGGPVGFGAGAWGLGGFFPAEGIPEVRLRPWVIP